MKTEARTTNTAVAVMLAVIFAVMLVFNFLTPLAADDYLYSLNLADEELMEGIGDLAASLETHWRYSNGRVLAHLLIQIFLQLPKALFNIVNAANSALLAWLLYRFVKSGERKRDTLLFLSLAAFIWVLMPAFGQAFLWLTGSCNYSWCASLSLAFLYPYYMNYMGLPEKGRRGLPGSLGFCLLAFLAGGYSENGSLAALAAAFCLLALSVYRDRRLPRDLTAGFLAACGGFLLLMLAPSELDVKAGEAGAGGPGRIAEALGRLTAPEHLPLLLLALLGAVLLVLAFRRRRRRLFAVCAVLSGLGALALIAALAPAAEGGLLPAVKLLLSDVKENLMTMFGLYAVLMFAALAAGADRRKLTAASVFGLAAAASVLVFALAAYFPARGACMAAVYLAAACGLLLSGLWERGRENCLRAFCALGCLLMLGTFVLGSLEIGGTWRQGRERTRALQQARAAGEIYVTLEPIQPELKYSALWKNDFQKFSSSIATLYGFDEVWIDGVDYA